MKQKSRLNMILSFMLIAIALISAARLISLQFQTGRIQKENDAIARQVELQAAENGRLQSDLETKYDDEYIRDIARRELGYVLPGERVFEDISGQ